MSTRFHVLCAVKVNEMFTAMISRTYLAVTLIGLTLALGAGWGLYEQRRERGVEAPASATETRAPQPAGDPAAPEAPAAETSASATVAPAEVGQAAGKSAVDRGSADETAAPARPATAAPVDEPREVARRPAPAARPPAPEEPAPAALAIGQTPAATASVPGEAAIAETEPQIAGPSSATAPAPSPPPEPKPSAAANVAAAAPTARGEAVPRVDADARAPRPAAGAAERAGSAATDSAASEARPKEPAAAAPRIPPAAVASDQGDPAGIEPGAAPSFDIVRIAPDGRAVMAGRAAPDAEVELRSGDRVIDRVRADRRGEWVALPPELLAAGEQELTLAARVAGRPAVESDEVLVVAVPSRPAPEAGGEPETAAAEPPPAPLAMALPREGRGQGRILQAPGRISSDGTLALMVLDYDETGRIRLHGEASPGAPLLIYVDNAPAGTAVVEPSGKWTTVLEPSLAPGDYTLRLDQLDPSGKPTARLETPFTRANRPPVEGEVQVDFVVVQPGNSLWRIARRLYGEGLHYVHIYGANQGQIRDPDLIYPGQVFEMPIGVGAAG
jgi:nucleoid-associated protein YgaU